MRGNKVGEKDNTDEGSQCCIYIRKMHKLLIIRYMYEESIANQSIKICSMSKRNWLAMINEINKYF